MFEVIFPKNDNFITALFEVLKLGLIALYVLLLNIGQLFSRKAMGIPVPKIAKSLNNHIVIRQKLINYEFTSYLVLRVMGHSYLIKHARQESLYIRAFGHSLGQKLKLGLPDGFLSALWHYITIGRVILSKQSIAGVIAATKALYVRLLKVGIGALHPNPVTLQKSLRLASIYIRKHPASTFARCTLPHLSVVALSTKPVRLMLVFRCTTSNTGIVLFTPSGRLKLLVVALLAQPFRVMLSVGRSAIFTLVKLMIYRPHTDIIPLYLYKYKDNL